jgi:hypothetical protein
MYFAPFLVASYGGIGIIAIPGVAVAALMSYLGHSLDGLPIAVAEKRLIVIYGIEACP